MTYARSAVEIDGVALEMQQKSPCYRRRSNVRYLDLMRDEYCQEKKATVSLPRMGHGEWGRSQVKNETAVAYQQRQPVRTWVQGWMS